MPAFRWTHSHLDLLERAIRERRRVALVRRGNEYVVTAARLTTVRQRDALICIAPMTGDEMTFVLDDVEGFRIVE